MNSGQPSIDKIISLFLQHCGLFLHWALSIRHKFLLTRELWEFQRYRPVFDVLIKPDSLYGHKLDSKQQLTQRIKQLIGLKSCDTAGDPGLLICGNSHGPHQRKITCRNLRFYIIDICSREFQSPEERGAVFADCLQDNIFCKERPDRSEICATQCNTTTV